MKLIFRQRLLSLLDSYDIYNEAGQTVYTVKGRFALGHCLVIYDAQRREVGTVRQRLLTLLPKFEMYLGERYVGCISRELTLFTPKYHIDCNGWQVEGNFFEWDYAIRNANGCQIAAVSKQLFNWTDTYVIEVENPADALCALMLVLAIDAEKCSRKD